MYNGDLPAQEMLDDFELFCLHPEARKVLLYSLSPRDVHHFSPQLVAHLLHAGDRSAKKALGLRALELRQPRLGLLPRALQFATERMTDLCSGLVDDRGRVVLLTEVLLRRWVRDC